MHFVRTNTKANPLRQYVRFVSIRQTSETAWSADGLWFAQSCEPMGATDRDRVAVAAVMSKFADYVDLSLKICCECGSDRIVSMDN
ncbi:hypothetical protein Rcae01_06528 [Novipirellula caenicola]|uniref:Uncharacterized protein n=1 Tax=Novipirellula caenicola TaxID=1536901 RepID=A0ABP9W2J9_9BACT